MDLETSSDSENQCESGEKKPPIEMWLIGNFWYLGKDEVRDRTEEKLGQTFSLNTIFCGIDFSNYKKYGLKENDLPAYIPYDVIKVIKEGESLILKLNGRRYPVLCKQGEDKQFELVRKECLKTFAKKPNFLNNYRTILIRYSVLVRNRDTKQIEHGPNASPYVKQILNN